MVVYLFVVINGALW